jgi:hypothetical protein
VLGCSVLGKPLCKIQLADRWARLVLIQHSDSRHSQARSWECLLSLCCINTNRAQRSASYILGAPRGLHFLTARACPDLARVKVAKKDHLHNKGQKVSQNPCTQLHTHQRNSRHESHTQPRLSAQHQTVPKQPTLLS